MFWQFPGAVRCLGLIPGGRGKGPPCQPSSSRKLGFSSGSPGSCIEDGVLIFFLNTELFVPNIIIYFYLFKKNKVQTTLTIQIGRVEQPGRREEEVSNLSPGGGGGGSLGSSACTGQGPSAVSTPHCCGVWSCFGSAPAISWTGSLRRCSESRGARPGDASRLCRARRPEPRFCFPAGWPGLSPLLLSPRRLPTCSCCFLTPLWVSFGEGDHTLC